MTEIDIDEETYQLFVQEALDLLQRLESGLLSLGEEHSIGKIHSLMRAAHSIKGGAACVGLTGIQNLAHQLENALKALYREDLEFDRELEDLLLEAYDLLRSPLLEQIETGECETDSALANFQLISAQLEAKLGYSLDEETFFPEVETDENLAQLLFTEEIVKGIDRWENLLNNSQTPELAEQLKIQAEIFVSIGEMLNLPDLIAVAKNTIFSLQNRPLEVKNIGELAISEFRAVVATVLKHKISKENSPQPETRGEQNPKLSVRVDLERLDLLTNLVGDLVTQENSFFLQYQQQKEILDALAQKLHRLHKQTSNFLSWSAEAQRRSSEEFAAKEADLSHSPIPYTLQTLAEDMAQLQEALQDMKLTQQQVQQIIKKRQQSLKKIQNNLLQARMFPLGNLLNRFPRMVRDLAADNHKQVNLQLIGMSTLIDKAILEKLYDPLIHLVRNAFDHGIETPEVREKLGKSAIGTITIHAYHRGNYTYIEVQDDGQGIEPEKISQRAIDLNLLSPTQASSLPKHRLYEYLFAPGFSTANKVSEISGRGVGLEAVKHQVSALKGSIGVTSELGKGTSFILRLPFTLTISRLFVFRVNTELMAIPLDSLVAIAVVPVQQIEIHQGSEFYQWQGQQIPVYSHCLISSSNYPRTPRASEAPRSSYPWQQLGKVSLMLISDGEKVIALKIDEVLMEQDLVIKPFGEAIAPPPYLYGCTILGNGRLVPVIDGSGLIGWLQQKKSAQIPVSFQANQHKFKLFSSPTILAIDDSLTIRKSLSSMLNKEGYRVLQACHGGEALELLRQHPEIRAIICDIEMPQMNGFEFLSCYQKENGDRSLPVIMLTCRSTQKYRALAQQLGVTAYLTKPYLDKQLLKILADCWH